MLGSGGVQISILFILIQYFVDFLSQNASDDVELMLLGNKSDVDDERKVTFQQGAKVKSKLRINSIKLVIPLHFLS